MPTSFRIPSPISSGARFTLRDGADVRLRQADGRADTPLLLRGFSRLSEESRYRRFLAPTAELSDTMVQFLTSIDHHDHEAVAALDNRTGEGIGVARFVRDPYRPDEAELAVTVIDAWQGRGVGHLLLEMLCERAREEGVARFKALMLSTNQEMMDLIRSVAPMRIVDHEAGTIEVEMPLGGDGGARPAA